jgi:hypothetical protein
MKKVIIALIILVAATTASASYEMLTPPGPQRNFAELSEDSTANGGSSALFENSVALSYSPTESNLARRSLFLIVAASALGSDEEAEQAEGGEGEDGEAKGPEEGRPDRMWGATKLG